MIRFKFLTKNENTLYSQEMINLCVQFFTIHMTNHANGVVSNRQLIIAEFGTFYITRFEYEYEETLNYYDYYGTVIFCHKDQPRSILTMQLKNDRVLTVTVSHP